MDFIIPFVGGAVTASLAFIAYAKFYGLNLLSIGKMIAASNAYEGLESEVNTALGNLSLSEIGSLLGEAKRLADGGFTNEEKEILFKKLIDAVSTK